MTIDTSAELAEAEDRVDGLTEDLNSALTVLIRRINGDADLASAAEWVRLNYKDRAKEIRTPLAAERTPPADVVERVARGVMIAGGCGMMLGSERLLCDDPRLPGEAADPCKCRTSAAAAICALCPGDEIPAGVVVPSEPTEAMQAAGSRVSDRHIMLDENRTPYLSDDGVIEVWAHMVTAAKGGEHE